MVGIYGNGTAGGAILRVKKTKRRVAVGGEVEGWLLEAVEPYSARFVKGASVDELALRRVDTSKIVKVVPSAVKHEAGKAPEKPEADPGLGLGGFTR